MAGSGSIAGTTAPLPSTGAAERTGFTAHRVCEQCGRPLRATTIEFAVLLAGVQAARPSQAA